MPLTQKWIVAIFRKMDGERTSPLTDNSLSWNFRSFQFYTFCAPALWLENSVFFRIRASGLQDPAAININDDFYIKAKAHVNFKQNFFSIVMNWGL